VAPGETGQSLISLRAVENDMYDETNVPGPEYKVRPVVRYLVTVYFHPYTAKDQHGFPLPIEGSSKVIGEFDRDDNAELVRAGLQKLEDAAHARRQAQPTTE
jgi:hypothetical protein